MLIRYRTRDLAFSLPAERDASDWPQVTTLIGRLDDAIKVRGTLVYPSVIEDVLTGQLMQGAEWRIVVDRKRAANDTIVVRYEHPDDSLQSTIFSTLYGRLGIKSSLEVVPPNTFKRFSGKAARVLDRRVG